MPHPILYLHWVSLIELTSRGLQQNRHKWQWQLSWGTTHPWNGQQLAKDTQHSSPAMNPGFKLCLCSALGWLLDKVTSLLIFCSLIVQ